MPHFDILSLFQGIATMIGGDPAITIGRIVLIFIGIAFVFLGAKGILEPLSCKYCPFDPTGIRVQTVPFQ